jgi:dolichyl-phosphate beta-glucosyltransferase
VLVKALEPLSIVIPAYNEGERLGKTLTRIIEWTDQALEEFEIIVVDDGSTDNTVEIAKSISPQVRVVSYTPNQGKGHAVRAGVLASTGNTVLFSDADLSTPIEECERLGSALATADIAIGSRGLPESDIVERQPWYRQTMGKTFNGIVRMLAVRGVSDTQCGFKLFRGGLARELFADLTISHFAFDVEILFMAQQRGYRIAEVPVRWINDERTHVNAFTDSSRMLMDVVRIRVRHLWKKFRRTS